MIRNLHENVKQYRDHLRVSSTEEALCRNECIHPNTFTWITFCGNYFRRHFLLRDEPTEVFKIKAIVKVNLNFFE